MNSQKEIFKCMQTIKFNNKNFMVLTSKAIPIYILEIEKDGKLKYPEYSDFINYYKMHAQWEKSWILNSGAHFEEQVSSKRKKR